MNEHEATEEKSDNSKFLWGTGAGVLINILTTIWKFCSEISVQNWGREDIFRPITGNESLHQDGDDYGDDDNNNKKKNVRIVNLATHQKKSS